jgi:isopenicillin N synthase-like dioxygenase
MDAEIVSVVTISYDELLDSSVSMSEQLLRAFGRDGLGVIAITDIPDWEPLVSATIPLAHKLVNLRPETLSSLEDECSMFNSGWSYGKEKLGDNPDTNKASFYFNPLCDNARPEIREKYPWAMPANRWPSSDLPDLATHCKALGKRMHEVVVSLAKRIDCLGYGPKIAGELEHSLKAKGRMLYYYPIPDNGTSPVRPDGWIGWHNDSGFLTGLTPDMYFEHSTGRIVPNPEPASAGLWVADRSGTLRRITIPPNAMAVQCGECMQIITGGKLVATPHCVRPPINSPGISRACMPLFVDSTPEFPLVSPNGREAVFTHTVKQWVPPLADRWKDGQTFAEFLGESFKAYYNWNREE